jgi:hypothetical protein
MGLISTQSPGGNARSQSGEPCPFLSFSLGEGGGGIRADEAGLLGVEGAGSQPGRPRSTDVAIGPGVPGRALVGGQELLALSHAGDLAGQPGAGPHRGGLPRDSDLGLTDGTVPVMYDVQASIDPAKVLGIPVTVPNDYWSV